jgi:hypothetical protein
VGTRPLSNFLPETEEAEWVPKIIWGLLAVVSSALPAVAEVGEGDERLQGWTRVL